MRIPVNDGFLAVLLKMTFIAILDASMFIRVLGGVESYVLAGLCLDGKSGNIVFQTPLDGAVATNPGSFELAFQPSKIRSLQLLPGGTNLLFELSDEIFDTVLYINIRNLRTVDGTLISGMITIPVVERFAVDIGQTNHPALNTGHVVPFGFWDIEFHPIAGSITATSDEFSYMGSKRVVDPWLDPDVAGTLIADLPGKDSRIETGLMFRTSLDGNSPFVALSIMFSGTSNSSNFYSVRLTRREAPNATPRQDQVSFVLPAAERQVSFELRVITDELHGAIEARWLRCNPYFSPNPCPNPDEPGNGPVSLFPRVDMDVSHFRATYYSGVFALVQRDGEDPSPSIRSRYQIPSTGDCLIIPPIQIAVNDGTIVLSWDRCGSTRFYVASRSSLGDRSMPEPVLPIPERTGPRAVLRIPQPTNSMQFYTLRHLRPAF